MTVKYLTQLANNPSIKLQGSNDLESLKPISFAEIANLETTYNSGNQFPASLVELLYLAGNYCYVLDYGLNDSQEEMQEDSKALLARKKCNINRPFFVIDVYNANDQFIFVYLDESVDDPEVQQAFMPEAGNLMKIYSLNKTLSQYVNSLTIRLLGGTNPF